jgi:hypothetical protein
MTDTTKSLSLIPSDLNGFSSLAEQFAKSKLIPTDLQSKPADVFVTLLAGHELGLSPMAALRGIHVVKGKPILSADTMTAVVLASGAAEYIRCVESTADVATYATKRKGDPDERIVSWTLADAKRAKLDGDNWTKYPRAMLKARCKAELLRDVYPDVLAGCYVEGEIDESGQHAPPVKISLATSPTPTAPAPDVIDAEVVERTPWDAMLARLQAATGVATDGWQEVDVLELVGAALDRETLPDVNAAMRPIGDAIGKAPTDPRLAALRAAVNERYAARSKVKAAS